MRQAINALTAEYGDTWAMERKYIAGMVEQYENDEPPQSAKGRLLPSVKGAVAVMPVVGVMTQRGGGWWDTFSTDQFGKAFDAVIADETIGAVVLDIDSPGGSVYGCDELASKIFAAREQKTIVAVSNSLMASAAYYIGSAASQIVVSPTSLIGSIGVYRLHFDYSKMMEAEGVDATFIFAGDNKVDGNPYEPLSDSARKEWQDSVDHYYGMFTGAVAKGRGITVAKVNSDFGQGAVFNAPQAVKIGMADKVGTLESVIAELTRGQKRPSRTRLQAQRVAVASARRPK